MKNFTLFILLLFPLTLLCQEGQYNLQINLIEIEEEAIRVDFQYHVTVLSNSPNSSFLFYLPFNANPELNVTFDLNKDNDRIFYGFNPLSKDGYCLLHSSNKSIELDIYFKNVFLPYQNTADGKENISVHIPMQNLNSSNLSIYDWNKDISPKLIKIRTKHLVRSVPGFNSTEGSEEIFEITRPEKGYDNVHLILPKKKKFDFVGLGLLFFLCVGGGFFATPKIANDKASTIIALILGIILFGISIYLVINKIILGEYSSDLDAFDLVGGALGLSIGAIISCVINLYKFNNTYNAHHRVHHVSGLDPDQQEDGSS